MQTPLDSIRASKLVSLARERFDPNLTPGELEVLGGSGSQSPLYKPDASTKRLPVRAELISWILTDSDAYPYISPVGLRVSNANVSGDLALANCHIPFALTFYSCSLEGNLNLQSAEVQDLTIGYCKISKALFADQINVSGTVNMFGVNSLGGISFHLARIGGDLQCYDSQLKATAISLLIDSATIGGSVFLPNGFQSDGAILAIGVQIGGGLYCDGAIFGSTKGALNFESATIRNSVSLNRVQAAGPIDMWGATIGGALSCKGAKISATGDAFVLTRATIEQDAFLTDGFQAAGAVLMQGIQIGGDLVCSGAALEDKSQALDISGATIKGFVDLGDGFRSLGPVFMDGVQIDRQLNCTGAELQCAGNALTLQHANIGGNTALDKVQSAGLIDLTGAKIGGMLSCEGAKIKTNGYSLVLDNSTIEQSAYLTNGFQTAGSVAMTGIQIGNDLSFSGAILENKDTALILNNAHIKGDVQFTGGFRSAGAIQMGGAQIGGNLDFTGAHLEATGDALQLNSANVQHDVNLSDGFRAAGAVRMNGIQIGSDLFCTSGSFNCAGDSITFERSAIKGSVFLRAAQFSGFVKALMAHIGGDLDCDSASIGSLLCRDMHVDAALFWTNIPSPKITFVSLVGAAIGSLHDDRMSWPASGNLSLEGFTYKDLILHEPATREERVSDTWGKVLGLNPDDRIEWLMLQPEDDLTKPQPWTQLAKLLESNGNPEGARKVIYEFKRVQAREQNFLIRHISHPVHWLEEQPIRIIWAIALLWIFGFLVFWRARRMRAMAPTERKAYEEFMRSNKPPSHYTRFSSIVYSLENILPVVEFGQDDAWAPNPEGRSPAAASEPAWLRWIPCPSYKGLVAIRFGLIVLGWILALIFAAAIGGLFKP